ncbi:MAG: dihydroorotase [Bacteroidetes bacterium]|nr:dihydroorotase [Bacteroidota bacterium]
MKVLLRQVLINDPLSPFAGSVQDIIVDNGKISQIGNELADSHAKEYSHAGWQAMPGFVDSFAHFNDPGMEYRETIETGAAAAAAGGFTTVMVVPNTKPVIDTKSAVEYIVAKNTQLPARVLPLGAVTRQTDGKELAEMYDMFANGAIAFSDGIQPIQSAGLLVKALQYIKAIDAVLIQVPDDTSIASHGLINEGIVSTRLGLPGKPMMGEELIVARDIKLARYADSKIHFTGVSSPKSIEYIRRAKDGGLNVTCSVTPYHLFFNDEDLLQYDTNLKVNPPLRRKEDMLLLRKAVLDGTVDCIATHHLPHNYDAKVLEFEYAKFGMIGLESAYAAVKTAIPELSDKQLTNLFSRNARTIFKLPAAKIALGQDIELTLVDPQASAVFSAADIRSKSRNSAFIGRELKGKIIGTLCGNRMQMNAGL